MYNTNLMALAIENFGLLFCITDSLKNGCFACIGPANDKHTEMLGIPS
jgi:hypothetical protein